MNRYKFQLNLKWFAINMFVTVSGVMLLVCYEWVIVDHNITGFMASKGVPCAYAIMVVAMCWWLGFKSMYVKKNSNE